MLIIQSININKTLEGLSLTTLLSRPNAKWERPILTTFGPGNHTLRSKHFRYIRYVDGSEELYDHRNDPHEWHNLAKKAEHKKTIEAFKKWLPKKEFKILGKNSTGHKAYDASAEAMKAKN